MCHPTSRHSIRHRLKFQTRGEEERGHLNEKNIIVHVNNIHQRYTNMPAAFVKGNRPQVPALAKNKGTGAALAKGKPTSTSGK